MNKKRFSILVLLSVLFTKILAGQIQEWAVYDTLNSDIPSNFVTSVTEDLEGNIWIGTYRGLVKITTDGWSIFTTTNSEIPSNGIETITVDSNNTLWVGFAGEGMAKYSNNTWEHFTMQNSELPSSFISQIIVDKLNRKWIATQQGYGAGGILMIDDATYVTYTEENSELSGGSVSSIALDDSLGVWIGADYIITDPGPVLGGLNKFYNNKWTYFDVNTLGFSSANINCIEVKLGKVWVGTDWGLSQFDGSNWITLLKENSNLPNNHINSVAVDSNGFKWLGVGDHSLNNESGALVKFKDDSFSIFNTTNSPIPFGYVGSIFVDSYQNKWIAVSPYWDKSTTSSIGGGLVVYNENGVTVDVGNYIENKTVQKFNLTPNFPNPFNPSTTINYSIPKYSFVSLVVFNSIGEKVKTLVSENKNSGSYSINFNSVNLPSGIYFLRFTASSFTQTNKMVLLR